MKLQWDKVGERRFETGVDRGVLYIDDEGYAWSGLLAVKESNNGGELKSHYVDGVRFANRLSLNEYEATIDAFTYPEAFGVCDGTKSLGNGLFVSNQRRKQFGFSYRTRIGNDLQGLDYGYKLHVVYNALAQPTDREYQSVSDSVEPFVFSWKIVTKPPVLNFVPTAHFIIDSRTTPDAILSEIESILYGTEMALPRLPSAGELVSLFQNFATVQYDAGDPDDIAFTTIDGAGAVRTDANTTLDGGTP